MLCYVMLYYVKLCYVMLCYIMLSYVTLCYVMLCYVPPGFNLKHFTSLPTIVHLCVSHDSEKKNTDYYSLT